MGALPDQSSTAKRTRFCWRHWLIDEYRIIVNPVLIGEGISMFRGLKERQGLKLVHTLQLGSGVEILTYQPLGRVAE